MANTCGTCGLPLTAGDAFCGNCGQPAGMGAPPPLETGSTAAPGARARWPGTGPGSPAGPAGALPSRPQHQDRGQEGFAGPLSTGGGGRARIREAPANGGGAGLPPPPHVATQDDAIPDRQLSYTDVSGEPSFDPLRNSRFGWQLVRRAALFLAAGIVADTAVFIFLLLVAAITRSPAVVIVTPIISFVLAAVLFVAYLVMPVPALLAQWSRLLSFHAAAGETAFEHISAAMQRHDTPVDSLRPRTLRPPGEGARRYLELRRGVFSGFISCFEHGRDLYLGWTFWIYMSPWRLLVMKIGRQVQDWTGRGDDMHQTLRYESTRATIAALHSCTLEGIDAAIHAIDPEAGLAGGTPSVPIT